MLIENALDKVVLLYYKFVEVKNVGLVVEEHLKFCKEIGLKGRVLIAEEGINGTVVGTKEATEKYKEFMNSHELFSGIEFKENPGDSYAFNKMKVKARKEIIARGFKFEVKNIGKHLSPEKFQEMIENDKDVVIVDFRNDYEYKIGRFKGAVNLGLENFRDLPKVLDTLKDYKDKKILAYCTGGIRCEPASAFLKEHGFKEVYQLHGGIIKYAEKFPDKNFEGSCFVFDNRITVPVNKTKDLYVSHCEKCGVDWDLYVNCANVDCNKLFICCEDCAVKVGYSCSEECSLKKRNFEEKDYLILIKKRFENSKALLQLKAS